MESEKENLQFYIFKHKKLGDSFMTIHQTLESVYGTSLHLTLFAGGSHLSKEAGETTNWSTRNCHGREYHIELVRRATL